MPGHAFSGRNASQAHSMRYLWAAVFNITHHEKVAHRLGEVSQGMVHRKPFQQPLIQLNMTEVELFGDLEGVQSEDAAGGARDQLAVQERITALANTTNIVELRLLRDVAWLKSGLCREDGHCDAVVLASKLAAVGHTVSLRTALGGGHGQECFHNLHHEFLVVTPHAERAVPLVVDARFREQFDIPHATPFYAQVLQLVPEEFVGTPARLVPLVQLLCGEMAAAFRANAATCPPWRQPRSILSKWLPARSRDTPITCGPAWEGSSPRVSDGRASSSSLDDFDALVESGVSPTGPLPCYSPGSFGKGSLSAKRLQETLSRTPPVSQLMGFKVKSLLSSGLAFPGAPAAAATPYGGARLAAWEQPAIRTVKMAGRGAG